MLLNAADGLIQRAVSFIEIALIKQGYVSNCS